MTRSSQLSPRVALALVLGITLVLAALLARPASASLWPVDPSSWFGNPAGGGVRLDRPAR